MCTAVSWKSKDHYFGRTLDLEYSLGEQVIITPRYYPLTFRHLPVQKCHYAMIGMAVIHEGSALYFDAVNEMGLGIAALNFPGCAHYRPFDPKSINVPSYEVIPWILSQCASLAETRELLLKCNITNEAFNANFPTTPLHWLIASEDESMVLESVSGGIHLHKASGVLTNAPEYPRQIAILNAFQNLTSHSSRDVRGSGSLGLPGDLTSQGRFVRAAFMKRHSVTPSSEADAVEQFFHLMDGVSQPEGCVVLPNEKLVCTRYTCCCNADMGIYYYVTHTNRRINAVDLHRTDLKGQHLICYPLQLKADFRKQN